MFECNYSILLVDDESCARKLIEERINKMPGATVTGSLSNGFSAQKYLREHVVDIVITDIKMPLMDGLQLVELIHQFSPSCPRVIISGYEEFIMPKFVLQPLIENSLQHGISLRLDIRPGSLRIQISQLLYTYNNGKELVSICIDVIDNGMGIDEEKLKEIRENMSDHHTIRKEHIGLFNVSERLYLLFHEEQEVSIESEFGKGTHVRLVFPIQEETDNNEGMRG